LLRRRCPGRPSRERPVAQHGSVYDTDRIVTVLRAGLDALDATAG